MTRADHMFAPHNDGNAFEAAIRTWRAGGGKGRVWIAFETLYSMEGDMAPIADFAKLAEAEDAWLLMDEEHATCVQGRTDERRAGEECVSKCRTRRSTNR